MHLVQKMERSGKLNSKSTTNDIKETKEEPKKKIKDLFIVLSMVHALTGEDAFYNNDNYEDWEDEIFND